MVGARDLLLRRLSDAAAVSGTVLLLPVLVFKRAYPLYFLAQFGPEYDVFPPRPGIARIVADAGRTASDVNRLCDCQIAGLNMVACLPSLKPCQL